MKKQLILAAISAALIAAPFGDAVAKPSSGFGSSSSKASSSSGFGSSSSKSSSSTSTSSSKRDSGSSWGSSSTSSSTKRDTGSGWGSSSSATPAPKRDYGGSGWGSATPTRPAAPTYAPTNRVTPLPKQVAGVSAPNAAAQPVTGFSDTKSSTKKKIATVAGATALGGALYAAGANHDAVAAYQRSQEPAAPVSASTASTTLVPDRTASTTHVDSHAPVHASAPSYPSQPQVIVVREAPRYDNHADDAYWYQRGRESAARDARINNPVTTSSNTYGGSLADDTPVVQQAPRASQVTQPAAPTGSTSADSSDSGSFFLYAIVIVMVLGAMAYLAMQVLNTDPTRKSRAARRKSNYTL